MTVVGTEEVATVELVACQIHFSVVLLEHIQLEDNAEVPHVLSEIEAARELRMDAISVQNARHLMPHRRHCSCTGEVAQFKRREAPLWASKSL